jgi:hypothetical protein
MKNPKFEIRNPKGRIACSADFQSAGSRISNPQCWRTSDGLPNGIRRYSRLETCATGKPPAVSPSRRFAVSFLLALALVAGGPAAADTVFHDDFNGSLNPARAIMPRSRTPPTNRRLWPTS